MHEVRGVVARAKGEPVGIETVLVPEPGPGEALVAVQACGVCHTDLHYREGGINDDFPFLLGHEAAGIVEAVGPDVTERGARRLRDPQLAGGVRAVPELPQGQAVVLLLHLQRHAEDDPGRRHRAEPGARHRRVRRQDAGRRRSVHQGRSERAGHRRRAARLRRDGRPGRGHQHRRRRTRRLGRRLRLRRGRQRRDRRRPPGRRGDDRRRRHRRPEAGLGQGLRRHPHRQLPKSRTPSRPSRPPPAATAPMSASRPSACPQTYRQAFEARDLAGTVVLVGVPRPDMTIELPVHRGVRSRAARSSRAGTATASRPGTSRC